MVFLVLITNQYPFACAGDPRAGGSAASEAVGRAARTDRGTATAAAATVMAAGRSQAGDGGQRQEPASRPASTVPGGQNPTRRNAPQAGAAAPAPAAAAATPGAGSQGYRIPRKTAPGADAEPPAKKKKSSSKTKPEEEKKNKIINKNNLFSIQYKQLLSYAKIKTQFTRRFSLLSFDFCCWLLSL